MLADLAERACGLQRARSRSGRRARCVQRVRPVGRGEPAERARRRAPEPRRRGRRRPRSRPRRPRRRRASRAARSRPRAGPDRDRRRACAAREAAPAPMSSSARNAIARGTLPSTRARTSGAAASGATEPAEAASGGRANVGIAVVERRRSPAPPPGRPCRRAGRRRWRDARRGGHGARGSPRRRPPCRRSTRRCAPGPRRSRSARAGRSTRRGSRAPRRPAPAPRPRRRRPARAPADAAAPPAPCRRRSSPRERHPPRDEGDEEQHAEDGERQRADAEGLEHRYRRPSTAWTRALSSRGLKGLRM